MWRLLIGAESLWGVNGIIAIFSALYLESAPFFFERNSHYDRLLHCYQNPVELKLVSIGETE